MALFSREGSRFLVLIVSIFLGSCANIQPADSQDSSGNKSDFCKGNLILPGEIDKNDSVVLEGKKKRFEVLSRKYRGHFGIAEPAESTQWFYTRMSKVRGIAVVVHGLNLRPSKMNDIVRFFQDKGIDVLRVTLTGHRGDFREIYLASKNRWQNDLRGAYCLAQDRASVLNQKMPIYFVGHSLGGLINLDLLTADGYQGVRYDKMVLFSPAIAVNGKLRILRTLTRFLFSNPYAFYPSPPARYRRDYLRYYRLLPDLPILAYDALFDSLAELQRKNFFSLNIPTLVFIDSQDELVSMDGILKIVSKNKLNQWKVVKVKSRNPILKKPPHHAITDEDLMGDEWKFILQTMSDHIGL